MSRFFKRALDAYRILTGKDDAVQKGIMQLQKEITEREARRATQQAIVEQQILEELRQSANALKTIKEGYKAQEEELSKFAASLGEHAQAQLAAQAEAEAQLLLETARRSGVPLQPPAPFSQFVKQASSGLASGEATTAVVGELPGGEGNKELGQLTGQRGGQGKIIAGAGMGYESPKLEEGAGSGVGLDMGQESGQGIGQGEEKDATGRERGGGDSSGVDRGLGQTNLAGREGVTQKESGGKEQEEGLSAPEEVGSVRSLEEKIKSETDLKSQSDTVIDLRSDAISDLGLELEPETPLVSLERQGGPKVLGVTETQPDSGPAIAGQESFEHASAGVLASGIEEQPQPSTEPVRAWEEAVDENSAEGGPSSRQDKVGLVNRLDADPSASDVVTSSQEGALATKDTLQGESAARALEAVEPPLPPFVSQVVKYVSERNGDTSERKAEISSRKGAARKKADPKPEVENEPQGPKVRKKRATVKSKANL